MLEEPTQPCQCGKKMVIVSVSQDQSIHLGCYGCGRDDYFRVDEIGAIIPESSHPKQRWEAVNEQEAKKIP